MTGLIIPIVSAVASGLICGVIAFILGVNHRKRQAETAIGSAEEEASRILSDALKNAEAKKKEAVLEAREDKNADSLKKKNRLIKNSKIFRKKKKNFKKKCVKLNNKWLKSKI